MCRSCAGDKTANAERAFCLTEQNRNVTVFMPPTVHVHVALHTLETLLVTSYHCYCHEFMLRQFFSSVCVIILPYTLVNKQICTYNGQRNGRMCLRSRNSVQPTHGQSSHG